MPDVGSNWKITLDPEGEALVLVDFGQRMNDELTWGWKQVVDEVKKQGGGVDHFPRGNVTGAVAFGSYKDHADDAAAREWLAYLFIALGDFINVQTTMKVEIAGGDTFTISKVVLEEAPTKLVTTAPVARTLTTWKLRAGEWTLSGTSGPDPIGLDGALVNLTALTGMLDAGGEDASNEEGLATWDNSGTEEDWVQATSGNRPKVLNGAGLWLPGIAGNGVRRSGTTEFTMANSAFTVRIDAVLPSYRPASQMCLASKWRSFSNQRSWRVLLNTDGTITLEWSTDGTTGTVETYTSTVPLPLSGGEELNLMVARYDFTTIKFGIYRDYDSDNLAAQLGDLVTSTNSLVFGSIAALGVGSTDEGASLPLKGLVKRVAYMGLGGASIVDSTFVVTFTSGSAVATNGAGTTSYSTTFDRTGTDPAVLTTKPLARFDGSNDVMAPATPPALNAVNGITLACVFTPNKVTGTQDLIYLASNDADPRALLRMNGTTVELLVRRTDAEAVATVDYAGAFAYGTAVSIVAVIDYVAGEGTIYVDGSPKKIEALTSAGVSAATDCSAASIGAGAAGANPAAIDLRHVYIADEALALADVIALVETLNLSR